MIVRIGPFTMGIEDSDISVFSRGESAFIQTEDASGIHGESGDQIG